MFYLKLLSLSFDNFDTNNVFSYYLVGYLVILYYFAYIDRARATISNELTPSSQ